MAGWSSILKVYRAAQVLRNDGIVPALLCEALPPGYPADGASMPAMVIEAGMQPAHQAFAR